MNRRLTRLFAAVIVAFALMEGACFYWQVWRAPKLATDLRNPRYAFLLRRIPRGGIYTYDGETMAESVKTGSEDNASYTRRYYVDKAFGPIIGYAHERFGLAGIEAAYNDVLTGRASLWQRFAGSANGGPDLVLSIDSRIQRAAEEVLGNRRGAVVVLDPANGRILASATAPGFDPNRLDDDFESLRNDKESPLFDRVFKGLYPPGSAFKIVVLAGALENGKLTSKEPFNDEGYIVVDGRRLENFRGTKHGKIGFEKALAVSSNAFFAWLGLELGPAGLEETAKSFLFDRVILPTLGKAGRWGDLDRGKTAVAEMSIGQADLVVTPLHMALATAIIANGGTARLPRLVVGTRDTRGRLREFPSSSTKRVISRTTAATVKRAMVSVVEDGTGRLAKVPGIAVAGKSGTAEHPSGEPHAWFVGFAPAERPKIAFAIVLENGGSGGGAAAPLARRLIDLTLRP